MYLKRRIRPQSILWILSLFAAQILAVFLLLPAHQAKAATDPWYYNSSFQYRKKITIDGTKVQGSLNNFPVLISIIDGGLASKAQSNGNDILFTDVNGVKLNHEIESYNGATGDLKAWVKVPALSYSVDTVIYIYYGNPGASNQQNKTAVWDANYKMVQHLDETSTAHIDSTVNSNNGTPYGSLNQNATGEIDGADSFDGGNGYILVPNSTSLNPAQITMESWVKFNSVPYTNQILLNKEGQYRLVAGDVATNHLSIRYSTSVTSWSAGKLTGSAALTSGTWYQAVATYDGADWKLYLNGNPDGSKSETGSIKSLSDYLYIGAYQPNQWEFNGLADEVRLSNVARSADWIKTEYNNQSMPASFYSLGAQEIAAPSTGFNSSMLLIISVMSLFAGTFLLKGRYLLRQPS